MAGQTGTKPPLSAGPINAVLFDLDETLHARGPSLARFATTLYTEWQPACSQTEFVDTFVGFDERGYVGREGLFVKLVRHFKPAISTTGNVDASIQTALTDAELKTASDALAQRFRDTAWLEPALHDGALECLRELRRSGFRLGIITNGAGATQRRKLEASGLRPFFDVCTISEEYGAKKPTPEIFSATAAAIGASADTCVMVGDSPEHDIQGAHNVGMRTVWVARTAWPSQLPVCYAAKIERLSELPPAITSLHAS